MRRCDRRHTAAVVGIPAISPTDIHAGYYRKSDGRQVEVGALSHAAGVMGGQKVEESRPAERKLTGPNYHVRTAENHEGINDRKSTKSITQNSKQTKVGDAKKGKKKFGLPPTRRPGGPALSLYDFFRSLFI